MDRDEILTRYRRLRDIRVAHYEAALKCVSRPGIFDSARRLGLRQGQHLTTENPGELTLILDLSIYAGKDGHSRAIDRYAKAAAPAAGGEDAFVLDAMRAARFGVWRVVRRHETVGLVVLDAVRKVESWLVDERLEEAAEEGDSFATRLCQLGDFATTIGAIVPVDSEMLEEAFDAVPPLARGKPDDIIEDTRFVAAIYRAAIARGYFALDGDEEE